MKIFLFIILFFSPAMATLIDIGANLVDKSFKGNVDQTLKSAYEDSVDRILVTGTSLKKSFEAVNLVKNFQGAHGMVLACTVGIHPHSAKESLTNTGYVSDLRRLIQANRDIVLAVGETGLDYNRNLSPPRIQKEVFKSQMQLARDLQLPVFLHCRDAFEDFYAILKDFPTVVKVVHCHTDPDPDHLKKLLNIGAYIGITGWITDERRGQDLAKIVSKIPLDKLMIETDAPYLRPWNMPRTSSRVNEPRYLYYVAKKVAESYGITPAEIARKTTENALRVFWHI